jgi:hypothetical protein
MRTHTANGVEIACRRETAGSCRMCDLSDPASPHYRADYAALYGGADVAGTVTYVATATAPESAYPHAGRDLLVRGCDYRLDAVGLERGEGCGCTPMTRCLLGRGKWGDDPGAIDYGDCLECMS